MQFLGQALGAAGLLVGAADQGCMYGQLSTAHEEYVGHFMLLLLLISTQWLEAQL